MCLAEAAQSVAELGICHAARGPPPTRGMEKWGHLV